MVSKLCENLRSLRQAHKYSFKDLEKLMVARNCKISSSTLQRYEVGIIPNVPYDSIICLADIYQVSPCSLMGWSQEPILDYNEQELINNYRHLNPEGKRAASKIVKSFTIDPDYRLEADKEKTEAESAS
ncbi:MAG: helix-turn-helix domain-containing protein [Acidaminococcaceae bacterium]|nr:helix-turn-helix domain-containing protein [Acidaminococcaceae bacterium]